jgi:hypothetical protein
MHHPDNRFVTAEGSHDAFAILGRTNVPVEKQHMVSPFNERVGVPFVDPRFVPVEWFS